MLSQSSRVTFQGIEAIMGAELVHEQGLSACLFLRNPFSLKMFPRYLKPEFYSLQSLGQSSLLDAQKRSSNNRPLAREINIGSTYSIYSNGEVVEGALDGNGSSIPIVFTIRRSGSLLSPGEVQFRLKSGSAKVGVDVRGTKNYQTIQFPALELPNDGSSLPLFQEQTIEILVNDDSRLEYDEFLFGQLRRTQSTDQLATSMVKAHIINDDFKSIYNLSAESTDVEEGEPFNIVIERTVVGRPASIQLSLKGNTADIGDDVDDIGQVAIEFGPDDTEKSISLATYTDSLVEGDEALFARIDSDAKLDQVSKGNLKLKILDINQPSAYSILDPTPVTEGEDISFVVQRSGGLGDDGQFTSDGSFYFWTKKKTAKADDFQMFSRNKYVIPRNQSTYTIDVGTIDDDEVESDESIIGFIRPFYKSDRTSGSSKTAIINDNDVATTFSMDLVSAVDTIPQSEFDEGSTARFRITRSTGVGAGSVKLKIRGTTAKADKDFVRPSSPIVTFSEGVTEQFVDINFADDDRVESKESFFASLKTVDRVDKVSSGRQRFHIIDNDSHTTFDLTVVQEAGLEAGEVNEGETSTFRITRSGGNLNKSSKVRFTTNPGSASKENDYAGIKKTVIKFESGEEFVDIPVETFQDYSIEGNEKFYASIRPVNRYDMLINRKQKVTILDDDKPANFLLETSNDAIGEGNFFTINVSRAGGEGRVSSALVWTSNGDAKSGKDYEKLPKLQIDFLPDEAGSKTFLIPTLADDVADENEFFHLNIRPLNRLDAVEESRLMLTIN